MAVAEDVAILRKGLCKILSSYEDYTVCIEASNGRMLIEQIKKTTTRIDICLLDISMPEMDGHQTISVLKKEFPNLKVLVLSMYNDDYNIIRMLKNGANGYVLKSANPDELHTALQEIHHKSFYHTDLVNMHMMQIMQRKEDGINALTTKETEFLSYCCSELTFKEIADLMNLSPRTVEGYRNILCNRLNIKSRTGLVMYALKIGIVPYET